MQNLLILMLVTYLLNALSLWKLFTLAGEKSWKAFVPFYNRYTQLQIIERPKWWIIILCIPIVSAIFHFVLHADFIRSFGKRKFTDGLLVFLTLGLYVTYINYNKNTKYTGVEEREETFVASILFAIIFATVVHTFIAQPFIIPTGSMESTLKVGDFLIVNKMAYGTRVPMTPISVPFLQNKLPLTGKKTVLPGTSGTIKDVQPHDQTDNYLDCIRIPYMRIPGYDNIDNNDLVVFNYPTDSSHTAIDRKDPYVKRCVAIPGDVLEIKDGHLFINGKEEVLPADAERQFSYNVETDATPITKDFLENELSFVSDYSTLNEFIVSNVSDSVTINSNNTKFQGKIIVINARKYNNDYIIQSYYDNNTLQNIKEGIPVLKGTIIVARTSNHFYELNGLSDEKVKKLKAFSFVNKVERNVSPKGQKDETLVFGKIDSTKTIFPEDKNWNVDNYGPLKMPKKGEKITLTQENITQYYNIINRYEDNNIEIKGNDILVEGKKVNSADYTIQQDYYFMIGDNRHNSLDSRFFGYVPFDHVMGKPTFYWMSLQGWFDKGSTKLRFDRMFRVPNNGTPMKDKFNWGWIIIPALIGFFIWDSRKKKKKKK